MTACDSRPCMTCTIEKSCVSDVSCSSSNRTVSSMGSSDGRRKNSTSRLRAFSLQAPKPLLPGMRSLWWHRSNVSKHASLENVAVDTPSGALQNDEVQPLDTRFAKWSAFTRLSIESIRSWGKETLPCTPPAITTSATLGNEAPPTSIALANGGLQVHSDSVRGKRQSIRRMKHSRLVQKNGDCNVSHMNVPKKERQYIRDIFTTLIDVKWRYILVVFASGFVASWTFFAVIYYVICFVHGDLENYANDTWPACVKNVHDFTSVFLFSVESQHTIGYGNRYTTTNCSAAITTLCIQSICGLLIQSFMAGLVFAKLARPKKRAETLIFSKNACISLRDGLLCVLFRVGDMRNTHLVESHLRLQLIKKRSTAEGEVLPLHQYDMDIGYDDGLDRIFLVWPITICHVIDVNSPLYEYAADDLATAQFEIIVILEGIVESTGMTAQARTSYLPSEIMWGHRFEKLITFQKQNGAYQIDYSRFHKTFSVKTPRCSAKDLDSMKVSGPMLGMHYYQKSADDMCDSESYTPSTYTRASSFGDEEMANAASGVKCKSPTANHAGVGLPKGEDEQKRLLLSPGMAKTPRQLRKSPNADSSNWTLDSSQCTNMDRQHSSMSSCSSAHDPPEIVIVAPSSPSMTPNAAERMSITSSILRQHDIM